MTRVLYFPYTFIKKIWSWHKYFGPAFLIDASFAHCSHCIYRFTPIHTKRAHGCDIRKQRKSFRNVLILPQNSWKHILHFRNKISNRFWRWSGYISVLNFRPFLPEVLIKLPQNLKYDQFHLVIVPPKREQFTGRYQNLISWKSGQDTLARQISCHFSHAFLRKCPKTSWDGRTDGKSFGWSVIRVILGRSEGRSDDRLEGRMDGRTQITKTQCLRRLKADTYQTLFLYKWQ